MGRALGELGHRVVILDRSVGEAAAALGLKARYDLLHALEGDRRLDDVLLRADDGLCVLPAARGLERLAVESDNWRRELAAALPALGTRFDVWLVNGLLPGAAPEAPVVLAIAPTARAVTTAYGHIKALARAQGRQDFDVLVHRAPSADAAQQVFSCVADTAARFLAAQLQFLGMVPRERAPGRAGAGTAEASAAGAFAAAAQSLLSRMQPGAEPRLANP
jgi:flagellar biosynthesis protein FlhG